MKLAYEKIIKDAGIRFLIEQGWLSKYEQYIIPEFTVAEVVKQYLISPEKWGKSIIYMKTKGDCDEVNRRLQQAGMASDVMYSDQTLPIREDIFEKFEDGRLKVLINIYLLSEGLDVPDLQTVFIRDTVKLMTIQCAGRVLRLDPQNKNKIAKVVQSEGAIFPFFEAAKPISQFVWTKNKWFSISENEMVSKISKITQSLRMNRPINIISDHGGTLRIEGDNLLLCR